LRKQVLPRLVGEPIDGVLEAVDELADTVEAEEEENLPEFEATGTR